MKKLVFTLTAGTLALTTLSSCGSTNGVANTMGIGALQNLLFNASNHGFNILGNPNDFMTNALIESAMPDQLRKVNSTLQSIGLSNLVTKEKQYFAQAAQFAVITAKPIVSQAIKEMTVTDAINIAAGGKGAATAYLKNKTREKLIAAMQPQVDQKLNEFGIVKTLNTALNGSSASGILGSILGTNQNNQINGTAPISRLASEQMVNGLFYVIENYEVNNLANPNAWGLGNKQ